MITCCFLCGNEKNEIALLGRMRDDAKAPMRGVIDKEPCNQCKEYMGMGVLIIAVDEKLTTDFENPYRTGEIQVITMEAAERLFTGEHGKAALEKRACFMGQEMLRQLGFPLPKKEGTNGG